MFKRRKSRTYLQLVADSLYPRGGWGRAFAYVVHRLRRLPDPPYKIARGIFAGVFVTFTPFYGLHFLIAAGLALAIRGNVIASLMATFFGNPLTYVPIALVSLQTGHFLLGSEFTSDVDRSFVGKFWDAGRELFYNLYAISVGNQVDWTGLRLFYHDVFLPYLVGGIIPGLIAGLVCYYLSAPVIAAYQKRRFSRLRQRAEKRLAKRAAREEAKARKDNANG